MIFAQQADGLGLFPPGGQGQEGAVDLFTAPGIQKNSVVILPGDVIDVDVPGPQKEGETPLVAEVQHLLRDIGFLEVLPHVDDQTAGPLGRHICTPSPALTSMPPGWPWR